MIIDSQNQYDVAHALTVSGPSQNVIDHGSNRNLGVGEQLCVIVCVVVAPVATGTYAVKLRTSATDPTFVTETDLSSVTISPSAVAGTKYVIPIADDASVLRYTQLYYTLGSVSPAITVTAELTPTKFVQNDYYFPRGYVIK